MKNSGGQAASSVMMIRPAAFSFNEQTSWSNAFQKRPDRDIKLTEQAQKEFDGLAALLKEKNIETIIFQDTLSPKKPDAVFCNNWISFQNDGTVVLYPMMAINRRYEKRKDILKAIQKKGFKINRLLDYSKFEETGKFLESTGSMVFDHVNKIVYACLSPRTDLDVLNVIADQLEMELVYFTAIDRGGRNIYHTNVMMAIGDRFAVICEEAIPSDVERKRVIDKLAATGHEVIAISYDQLYAFAGNMIQLNNGKGEALCVMSKAAFHSLSDSQLQILEKYASIIYCPVPVLEKYGGGSIRCMLADIHLPRGDRRRYEPERFICL